MGGYYTSEKIAHLLKELHNIETECYIDNDRMKVDYRRIYPPEYFTGKSQEYYIVVPIGYYKSVSDSLKEMGYSPIKDYYYFCDCLVRAERNYYEDRHGNIICGIHEGIRIPFCSYNVHIEIGERAVVKNCRWQVDDNAHIEIEEGVVLKNCTIRVDKNAYIKIGANTVIDENRIICNQHSNLIIGKDSRIGVRGAIGTNECAQLTIGAGFTCERDLAINASKYTKISIGTDCMFSFSVTLFSGDEHSIFDIISQININSSRMKMENTALSIGDHVWIGMNNTILGNTKIGNGSMVGAASFVKGCFPNNCILAGNPARILRKDIAWSREKCADDIRQCGQENINLTHEQEDVKENR